jgi:phosphorylcholine metabolism protein LicD
MNLEICEKNLIELTQWLEINEIEYYICFGTLLGAIRENDFIKGDTDTDLIVHERFLCKFDDVIKGNGFGRFKIMRVMDAVISFIADGEYIDVYPYYDSDGIFYKYGLDKPKFSIYKEDMQPGKFVTIRGKKYPTIKRSEKYLEHWYGEWKTPRDRQWCIDNGIYEHYDKAISL